MTPLSVGRRRAVAASVLATVFVSAAAPAWAQASDRQPVVDSAPRVVAFRAPAAISGHLDNAAPGDEVALERRKPGGEWKTIARKSVRDDGRVRFDLGRLRITSRYRLSYADETASTTATSDAVRIRVRPRLRLEPRRRHVMQGRTVRVAGRLYPKRAGRRVVLEQKVAGEWRWIGRASVRDGRFRAAFKARHPGFRRLRARFAGDRFNTAKRARSFVRIYRHARATWYGPGLYGNRTACGRTLTSETLGVAHRTLACGTKVSILYQGRTITVPVIDRGPYGNHAEYDLTEKTAERLRFSGLDTIGVTVKP